MVSWVTQPSEQLPFAANVCMIDAAVVLDAGNTPTATANTHHNQTQPYHVNSISFMHQLSEFSMAGCDACMDRTMVAGHCGSACAGSIEPSGKLWALLLRRLDGCISRR
jgi:hypothetical protein